jgi:MFS family permease
MLVGPMLSPVSTATMVCLYSLECDAGPQETKRSNGGKYFDQPKSSVLGTMNAMYPLGKLMGVLSAAFIGYRWGLKVPLTFGLVLAVTGASLRGASQTLPMFIVSRWIVGFACAFISQSAPIFVTELAYPTQRGKVMGL